MLRSLILLVIFSIQFGQRDVVPAGSHVEYKTFQSKVLARELGYGIYLPPSYKTSTKRYPIVYFLHGMFENEMRWSTRGGTDLMLDRMIAEGKIGEFIVALPNGGTSFYTNARDGSEKWEDMIVSEFVPMIESSYRVDASRAARGISGTSMGGYGALKLAMKHPDMFGSVSAHSAVLLADLSAARVSDRRLQLFQSLFDRRSISTAVPRTTTVSMPAPSCSTRCSQKHPIPTKHTSIPAPTAGTSPQSTPANQCSSIGKRLVRSKPRSRGLTGVLPKWKTSAVCT